MGGKEFTTYEALEDAYLAGETGVTADSLKTCIFERLDPLMEVGRRRFADKKLVDLILAAYPPDDAMCAEKHATGGYQQYSLFSLIEAILPHLLSHLPESAGASLSAKFVDDQLDKLKQRLISKESFIPPLKENVLLSIADLLLLNVKTLKTYLKQTHILRCLWSVAPAGVPHLGHTIPLRILARISQIPGVHVSPS